MSAEPAVPAVDVEGGTRYFGATLLVDWTRLVALLAGACAGVSAGLGLHALLNDRQPVAAITASVLVGIFAGLIAATPLLLAASALRILRDIADRLHEA